MTRRVVALVAVLAGLATPSIAEAGYGVQPDGQTIQVSLDSSGYIAAPSSLEILVFLDSQDTDYYVWVSDSPLIGTYGTPVGRSVGSCLPTSFRAWVEAGKFTCSVSTILLRAGATYYWWLDYRRREPGLTYPQDRISGPFAFTLQVAASQPVAQPVPPTSAPASPTVPAAPVSSKTWLSAATLPSETYFDGTRSVKHTDLTTVVYQTMKALGVPRTLAIACWNSADYEGVAASVDIPTHTASTRVYGFWLGRQPRWLHLAPFVCGPIQDLLDTAIPNASRANMLTVALHETLHAYGLKNEAQTNCLAVQLVPLAAHFIGLTETRGRYLERLAVNITRRNAPPGYWNHARCRDGGAWDIAFGRRNLG